MIALLVLFLGFAVGSFLSALVYRYPRSISIFRGRSFCDHCKRTIQWHDNIPLVSYLMLGGKCRFCFKRISPKNPIIELSTGGLFLTVLAFWQKCAQGYLGSYMLCGAISKSALVVPLLLAAFLICFFIFIIDWEYYVIADKSIFFLATVALAINLLIFENFYERIFAGFLAANFLLSVYFITKGKGMGLGDVKLALAIGFFFGFSWDGTFFGS